MKNSILLWIVACAVTALAMISCSEKEPVSAPTETLNFFFSVADKQVAFTAMINYGDVFQWDFGDGQTSGERNPVHVYAAGGTYDVKLSVTGRGSTKEMKKEVSLALSNLQMLAGDNRYPNGKKWKISLGHSATDKFAEANENFSNVQALSPGILGDLGLGLGEAYDDEFTFLANGGYRHTPKNGGSLAGLVYVMVTTQGAGILKMTGTSQQFGLCYGAYKPQDNATFTFAENQDFTIATATGSVTYRNVMTLDFSGTEFIGFMDFTRKCIVLSLTPDKMQLALFVSTSQTTTNPTHAVLLTFEVVK
jgi:PKD repeat protein